MTKFSVSAIYNPEFINLQPMDINPLMSKCEIKVFYLGQNRNHSYITKEVATDMAKTLRGAPIVGWYREDKEDFADHGQRITFDADGMKIECMTQPYGFVSPDAQVWFQKFDEQDAFGNTVVREYMMTTGYIWTGQYLEAQRITDEGNPHSMELDDKTIQGHWAEDSNSGLEFFIVNDAIFSKLCVLGEDVEPCFEGSSVTAPNVSANFTKDEQTFKQTLYNMMQQLQFALQGGQTDMPEIKENLNPQDNTDEIVQVEIQIDTEGNPSPEDSFAKKEDEEKDDKDSAEGSESESDDSDKKEEEDDEDKKKKEFAKSKDDDDDKDDKEEPEKDDDKDKDADEDKKKYALLESEYAALQERYSNLEVQYQELVEFKNSVEDSKKDELINSFTMLSDEDKKDVIENKSQYSLDDIEAKLSVIFTKKTLEGGLAQPQAPQSQAVNTFNITDAGDASMPAWVKAVLANK